jgi:hypothetical protein
LSARHGVPQVVLETIEKLNLLEWFAVNFRSFGTVI